MATPECAASATTNCGCFFFPAPHNDTPCELGHYHQHDGQPPYNECMQYYVGNTTTAAAAAAAITTTTTHTDATTNSNTVAPTTTATVMSVEPVDFVSSVDDEEFLVDYFEKLVLRSVATGPCGST